MIQPEKIKKDLAANINSHKHAPSDEMRLTPLEEFELYSLHHNALIYIKLLETENNALIEEVRGNCNLCKHDNGPVVGNFQETPCKDCIYYRFRFVYKSTDVYVDNWKWRGISKEKKENV